MSRLEQLRKEQAQLMQELMVMRTERQELNRRIDDAESDHASLCSLIQQLELREKRDAVLQTV